MKKILTAALFTIIMSKEVMAYQQCWKSKSYNSTSFNVNIFDFNGDGTKDIILDYSQRYIVALDGKNPNTELYNSGYTSGTITFGIINSIADYDGDGYNEMVFTLNNNTTKSSVYAYNSSSYAPQKSLVGMSSLLTENALPANVSSGSVNSTALKQDDIISVDMNNDGIKEVIVIERQNYTVNISGYNYKYNMNNIKIISSSCNITTN